MRCIRFRVRVEQRGVRPIQKKKTKEARQHSLIEHRSLIAIMLGRLEMTVEDCTKRFEAYAREIFSHRRLASRLLTSFFKPMYSHERLVRATKELIADFDPSAERDKWRRNVFSAPNARSHT